MLASGKAFNITGTIPLLTLTGVDINSFGDGKFVDVLRIFSASTL
jgi:hypothetical protein